MVHGGTGIKNFCANVFACGRQSFDGPALFGLRSGLVCFLTAGRLPAADNRVDESSAEGPVNPRRVWLLVDGREKVNLVIDHSTNAHAALDLTGASELTVVAASEDEQEHEGAVILGVVSAGK